MSNALVYFARADLPLSVSCTLITNVISIGTLPMLLCKLIVSCFLFFSLPPCIPLLVSRSFLDTHIDAIPALLLPLDLWGQGFAQVSIPYGDVAGSMALVIVPTAMGIFLKQSSARYAAWGVKGGGPESCTTGTIVLVEPAGP